MRSAKPVNHPNLVFSRFYAVFFMNLSSLGNFFFAIFLFLSADENSDIDISAIKVIIIKIPNSRISYNFIPLIWPLVQNLEN